jgi:hypothetical protein
VTILNFPVKQQSAPLFHVHVRAAAHFLRAAESNASISLAPSPRCSVNARSFDAHGKRRARNSVSISGALFANVFIPGGGVNNTTPVKQAGNGDGETFVHIKAGGKCWLASGGKDFETLVYFGGEHARAAAAAASSPRIVP